MIYHWTKDLTLFTNGKSTLPQEQTKKIRKYRIEIVETEIDGFEHQDGNIQQVRFKGHSKMSVKAMYAKVEFIQHCNIPITLGCELTEQGYIKVDNFGKTNIDGIYAAGDNTNMMRAVSMATLAGSFINKEFIEEEFVIGNHKL